MSKFKIASKIDRQIIATRLAIAREELGLSQREVGRLLEIPQSIISSLESAQRDLRVNELLVLARLYQRRPTWFLEGIEEEISAVGGIDQPAASPSEQ